PATGGDGSTKRVGRIHHGNNYAGSACVQSRLAVAWLATSQSGERQRATKLQSAKHIRQAPWTDRTVLKIDCDPVIAALPHNFRYRSVRDLHPAADGQLGILQLAPQPDECVESVHLRLLESQKLRPFIVLHARAA